MYIIAVVVFGIGVGFIGVFFAEAINSGEGDNCHGFKAMAIATFCIILLIYEVLCSILQIVTAAKLSSTTMPVWITVHWMFFGFDLLLFIIWASVLGFGIPRESVAEGIMLAVIVCLKLVYAILVNAAGSYTKFSSRCC